MKAIHIIASLMLTLSSFIGHINSASLTVQPTNQTVKIGDSASFFCGVTGTAQAAESLTYNKLTPTNSLISLNDNPTNATKHNITEKYRLTVFDVAISDEGQYECELFPYKQRYTMSMTVVDPPTSTTLLWEGTMATVSAGVSSNLTCAAIQSRPPATFRWLRGSVDVTSQASLFQAGTNQLGYGSSQSQLPVTITSADVGTVYTCYVDLADMQNVTVATLPVQLSGASSIHITMGTLLAAVAAVFFTL